MDELRDVRWTAGAVHLPHVPGLRTKVTRYSVCTVSSATAPTIAAEESASLPRVRKADTPKYSNSTRGRAADHLRHFLVPSAGVTAFVARSPSCPGSNACARRRHGLHTIAGHQLLYRRQAHLSQGTKLYVRGFLSQSVPKRASLTVGSL